MEIPFDFKEPYQGKSTIIDFRIGWKDKPHFFDVKDFEAPALSGFRGGMVFEPHKSIRERINRCRKKFRQYKEFCCAAIFFNNGALAMLEEPGVMLGSMYGSLNYRIPIDVQAGIADPTGMDQFSVEEA